MKTYQRAVLSSVLVVQSVELDCRGTRSKKGSNSPCSTFKGIAADHGSLGTGTRDREEERKRGREEERKRVREEERKRGRREVVIF